MIKRAWLRLGLVSLGTLILLAGCTEFDRKGCETNWECRENFGVGSTCVDNEFCQPVVLPEGCIKSEALSYPPDIFRNDSARRSVTLGVIIDSEGQQLARATRLAMEMANIKGSVSNTGDLANFTFSAVVCDLSGIKELNSASVSEVARFLRDDVEAPVVVLGVSGDILGWASAVLAVEKGGLTTVESSDILIISANAGSLSVDALMRDTANLWTMAASEDAMFRRMGEQLVLRRMEPFITAVEDDPHENKEARLVAAYKLYISEQTAEKPKENFRVNTLVRASDALDSGKIVYHARRRAALQEGIANVYAAMSAAAQDTVPVGEDPPETTDYEKRMPITELFYAERRVVCGSTAASCVPSDVESPLAAAIGCTGAGNNGASVNCEPTPEAYADQKIDAVIVHTESRSLVDSFLATLLADEDIKAGIKLADPQNPGKLEVNTAFFLPPLASSGTTSIYSRNWTSDDVAAPGGGLDSVPAENWFQYIEEGRFIGVRQGENTTSAPYTEFRTAGDILLPESHGVPSYYFAQAYDALWLGMAAVAGRVIEIDRDASGAEAMEILQQNGLLSDEIRKRFSGVTKEELAYFEFPFLKTEVIEADQDLIPSRWQLLFSKIREDDTAKDKHTIYRFRGSSGEVRFTDPNYQKGVKVPISDQNYAGRERVSYDYTVWTIRAESRQVAEVDDPVDNSHCLPGIIAPKGNHQIPPGKERDPENMFVCSTNVSVCRTTFKTGEGLFPDLCITE